VLRGIVVRAVVAVLDDQVIKNVDAAKITLPWAKQITARPDWSESGFPRRSG
jgi:hypothetical protein